MPFWAFLSQWHEPSGMLWRALQPRAAFPPSSSSLTSTPPIRRGLRCRGQAAAGSRGSTSPCFYASIPASPGRPARRPPLPRLLPPALPNTLPGRSRTRRRRQGPKAAVAQGIAPGKPCAGWKEGGGLLRTASGQGPLPYPPASTSPSPPRAQPQPPGDTSWRRLSSFSLWCQGRRLGAGRLGALRPRPRLHPPGRGGEPRGR